MSQALPNTASLDREPTIPYAAPVHIERRFSGFTLVEARGRVVGTTTSRSTAESIREFLNKTLRVEAVR